MYANSFVSPAAASQLTCYLLQLVHEIVESAALTSSSSNDDSSLSAAATRATSTPSKQVTVAGPVSALRSAGRQHNGAAMSGNAAAADDITTIVALRQFLMNGIGGRMLEMLLMIDTRVSALIGCG